jgi:hypothetical protein
MVVTVGPRTLCAATYVDNFKLPLLLTPISDIEIAGPLAQRWPVVGAWFERIKHEHNTGDRPVESALQ